MEPRQLARVLETQRSMAGGRTDRLHGYCLSGLAFASGDFLAWCRVTASSFGPPFTSVWHCNPDRRWTLHSNVAAARSCARYFAPALHEACIDEIEIRWPGAHELVISAARLRLHLVMRVVTAQRMSALGAAARLLPETAWRNARMAARLELVSRRLLGVPSLALAGEVPAGHTFRVRPRSVWRVTAAAALLNGRDLGSVRAAVASTRTDQLTLPVHGLLTMGCVTLEPGTTKP